jgi:Cu2+-exporting ATPase
MASYPVTIEGTEHNMCCHGCQAVAQAIVDGGLTSFYHHRETPSTRPEDLIPEALARFELYDQPTVQAGFVSSDDSSHKTASLILEGITCAACVWLNEKHVRALSGVIEFRVNYTTHRAHLRWDSEQLKLSDVLKAISEIGYVAHPFDPGRQEQLQKKEKSIALRKLFTAGLGAMQVMMLAIAMYAADANDMSAELRDFMRWVSLVLTVPVVVYAAGGFFTKAWRDLSRKQLSMEVPVSIAIGGAFAASVWHTYLGVGEIYFDSVCMFTFFLLTSRYLEMGARHKAGQSAEALVKLLPATATRIQADGSYQVIPVADLIPGDHVLIRPGEAVPADGVVSNGVSSVDESLLTGESLPCRREAGDPLVGGSLNVESPLEMEVQLVGESTLVSGIVRLLDRAQSEKPQMAQFADHIAAYFVAGLLVIATLVAGFWLMHEPSRAFEITLAVLVVTCPCALSLATPTAVTAAIGSLTKFGLLSTRGHVLETLAAADVFVFDKTGTLTKGALVLSDTRQLADKSDDELTQLAATLAAASEHPVSKVLALQSSATYSAQQLNAIPGEGIEGQIDGLTYRLGRSTFVAQLSGAAIPDESDLRGTVVYLGSAEGLLAQFVLSDQLRSDAVEAVAQLAELGCQIQILSGDQQAAVDEMATQLSVSQAKGGLRPADKLAAVQALQAEGHRVVMVGDGVNDAPVLAAADVSIAMGQGAQLAHATADMVALSEKLHMLPQAIEKSRETRSIIRQNLFWALGYNVAAVPLAAMGLVPPWGAAIGMSLSSLVVVVNALRLR